jgi:predicted permease
MTSLELPQPLTTSIEIASAAAVPILLVLLGVHLSRSALGQHLKFLGLASIVKLGLGAGLAVLVAALLGSTGITRAVGVLQMSMPAAVTGTILATEFDSRPDLVSGAAVASTLLSIVSLTLLLSWLS